MTTDLHELVMKTRPVLSLLFSSENAASGAGRRAAEEQSLDANEK